MLLHFRHFAQSIRHHPALEQCDWLWSAVWTPYQAIFSIGGKVEVSIGGIAVQMPADFASVNWENYEPEVFRQAVMWIQKNPNGLVLDVGSALGAFSAVALFASETSNVVAFDSNLGSLTATRRFCRYAQGDRLQTVYGFVTEMSSVESRSLAEAVGETDRLLQDMALSGDPGTTRYVNLASSDDKDIPCNTLDALLAGYPSRPMLIKCDVEGAELLVLRGARQLLASHRPALLLSVHQSMLPDYGHTKEDVADLLVEIGYTIDVISIDHEEHWWCRHSRVAASLTAASGAPLKRIGA